MKWRPRSELLPNLSYDDAHWVWLAVPGGQALANLTRNPRLLTRQVTVDPVPYEMPVQRQGIAKDFLKHRFGLSTPFNGELLGLSTSLDRVGANGPVKLHRAGYFDHLVSDIATGYEHDGQIEDTSAWMVSARGELLDFSHNGLVNAIGVSSLALTSDGYLCIQRQSANNDSSSGLWAPSGSGSLEAVDIESDGNFRQALRAGALRELREELGLVAQDIRRSEFIGWARWLNKGGKPEFFFLAHLNITGKEALAKMRAADEQHYTHEWRLYTSSQADQLLVNTKDISLPLALALLMRK